MLTKRNKISVKKITSFLEGVIEQAIKEQSNNARDELFDIFKSLSSVVEKYTDNNVKIMLKQQGTDYYEIFIDVSSAEKSNLKMQIAKCLKMGFGSCEIPSSIKSSPEDVKNFFENSMGRLKNFSEKELEKEISMMVDAMLGPDLENAHQPLFMLHVKNTRYPIKIFKTPHAGDERYEHLETLLDFHDTLTWFSKLIKRPDSIVVKYAKNNSIVVKHAEKKKGS